MTNQPTKHRIGDVAFLAQKDGTILRTIVATVRANGYLVLNPSAPHFFTYENAREAAKTVVQSLLASEDITRKQEREFTAKLAELDTDEYRQKVESQPLLDNPGILGIATGEREFSPEVLFASGYIEPGTEVWGIVTPATHYLFTENWRPRPYFIISGLVVEEVTFARYQPTCALYRFEGTFYTFHHERLTTSEQAARELMVGVFETETDGTILPEKVPIFPVSEEQIFRKRTHDRIVRTLGHHSKGV